MNRSLLPEIEILVLTYNRQSLIGATLESLLAQQRSACRICVLDNGSTDDTAAVVSKFRSRGVELVRRGSNDPRACWIDLKELARGPWTMLFHDDELLHPLYLNHAAHAICKTSGSTVVVSGMRIYSEPEQAGWSEVDPRRCASDTAAQLAARLYRGFQMPFCSVIYRTDVLKRTPLCLETFGKVFDRPFVLEAARDGRAVVLLDSYVKYRSHACQDSADTSTGPFLPEVLALQRCYRLFLGESALSRGGRSFLRRNYRNLVCDFARLRQTDGMTRQQFLATAVAEGAASRKSLRIGCAYALLTGVPRCIERLTRRLV